MEFDFFDLFAGSHHVLVLDSHDTTTPDSAELVVVVELALELFAHGIKVSHVFLADVCHGDAGSGLHVTELSKVGFSADKAEGDTFLSAKSWKEDNHLHWVDVVGDNYELGLVLLNESGDVVESEFEVHWLGGLASLALGFFLQAVLLVFLGLWAVFGQQLKEFTS